jgi:tRNA(fMet)-specific endonuclease VapC
VAWLLDTNVLIHAQRGHPASVLARLVEASPDDVATSSVSIAELWYGAAKSTEPGRKQKLWRRFLEPISVLPFDREAGELHGELRQALRRQPIGERDLLIACIALTHDLTLVTANTREFIHVPDLRVEDWSK